MNTTSKTFKSEISDTVAKASKASEITDILIKTSDVVIKTIDMHNRLAIDMRNRLSWAEENYRAASLAFKAARVTAQAARQALDSATHQMNVAEQNLVEARASARYADQ
jgi:hypothetical protein